MSAYYVSTTAFRRTPIEEVLRLAEAEGLALEFSSGLPYRADMEAIYRAAKVARIPHNYFPAPQEPFVLNLASLDEAVRRRSVEHCRNGLRLAAGSHSPFFSAHAGFCLDLSPKELGRPFVSLEVHPREDHWKAFLLSVRELIELARSLGLRFLVENNVVPRFNVLPDGSPSLLCVDAKELERMVREVAAPELGILIDTGHLKVSADTFGFSCDEALEALRPWLAAFHHSDNDGKSDSNLPFGEDYWFLKHVANFGGLTHILEVHDQDVSDIRRQFGLLERGAHATGH